MDHAAVVVSRWFGGVLLGSGGLLRAYGGTAFLCLRNAEKDPIVDTVVATVTSPFADLALLQARLADWPGVRMENPEFSGSGACWVIHAPKRDAAELGQMVRDLSAARARLIVS